MIVNSFLTGSSFETVPICCSNEGAMYVRIIYDSHDPNYKCAAPVRFVIDDDEYAFNVTVDKRHTRWIIGEEDKFINQTDKCLAKIMRALLKTHSKLIESFAFGEGRKDSFVSIVEVPEGNEKLFEQLADVKLLKPPKVRVN
jgi:hypothetical protein